MSLSGLFPPAAEQNKPAGQNAVRGMFGPDVSNRLGRAIEATTSPPSRPQHQEEQAQQCPVEPARNKKDSLDELSLEGLLSRLSSASNLRDPRVLAVSFRPEKRVHNRLNRSDQTGTNIL